MMARTMTRLKRKGGETNINFKKKSFMERLKERSKVAEEEHPGVTTDVPKYTLTRRAKMLNIKDVELPRTVEDVFDVLPTLDIAKVEFLEQRKMRNVISVEEKLNFEKESEEFNNEVQQDFDDAFGDERKAPVQINEDNFPQAQRDDDFRQDFGPAMPRRRPDVGRDFF